ncbi:hypothetical protein ACFL2Y_02560 [Candidatus Omnitrophota bacterium]
MLSIFIAILKDLKKTAIIVSIFLILFFSYGHISEITMRYLLIDILLVHIILMFAFTSLFVFASNFILKKNVNLDKVTIVLNVIATSLILITLFDISVYKLELQFELRNFKKTIASSVNPTALKESDEFPDIYYIILDRYASSRSLREFYDFDNSNFIDYLSAKGFYVASQSRANYLESFHSLSSSLNMEYINYLKEEIGEESTNWAPIHDLLNDFKVRRFLKEKGYKFKFLGPGHWQKIMYDDFCSNSKNNFSFEFLMTLYSTTMLYPIGAVFDFDKRMMKYKEIQNQFNEIARIAHMNERTFVLAHMLLPHWPYVFDRSGNFITRWKERKKGLKQGYLDQLIFTNNKIKTLIDKLLSSSEIPPVIIVQADEGPYPQKYSVMYKDEEQYNWENASIEDFRKKFRILNAYYLPGVEKSALYPSITPVNSFRIIFNHCFDTNFELLPDESYAFENFRYPYKFFNVSDKVKYN